MKKAVFLDRDGTINVDKNYICGIEEFEFLPEAINALKMLQDNKFILIIITNQSGIARGYYTENMFLNLNRWMLEQLRKEHINITDVYYCPHHPYAIVPQYRQKCECRKPQIGLFLKAVREHNIDLSKSYAIGDKLRDCEICRISDCKGFLIGNNEKESIILQVKKGKINNIEYQNSLIRCAEKICGRRMKDK